MSDIYAHIHFLIVLPPLTEISVVFSSWTKMLDLVQTALEKEGYQCERIDGTKSLEERKLAVESLNKNKNVTIMLASISSAGEG